MKRDKILCQNCGKVSIDTTEVKMQDSRDGKFKNMCPFCYGTSTVNLHENTKAKDKFIYEGEYKVEGKHITGIKYIKKPTLNTEHIAKQVLGWKQPFDNRRDKNDMSKKTCIETFVNDTKGTFHVDHIKSFTPLELMQQKLNNQHEELKSKPNNYKLYREWHYHRRLKNDSSN